jgi:hypothetical protein
MTDLSHGDVLHFQLPQQARAGGAISTIFAVFLPLVTLPVARRTVWLPPAFTLL